MTKLTQSRLKELLNYDPLTGQFTRAVPRAGFQTGSPVGAVDSYGYLVIRVDGKPYKAHRLAFLWMTGEFPSNQVDHKNRHKGDNSWSNLRDANPSNNRANVGAWRGKRLPKGVFARGKRFRAIICKNGRNINLGTFDTQEAAHRAYADAAKAIFGQFARVA